MARRIRALLVTAVAAMTIAAQAQTLRRVPVFRTGLTSEAVGDANIVVQNVHGPSVDEIVSCSNGAAFAFTKSGSGYKTVWYTGPIDCRAVAVGDVNADGAPEIIVGSAPGNVAGTVRVFSPDRLGPHRASVTLPGTSQVSDVAIGNVDNDAQLEIVAISVDDAFVYDAATLVLEWTATGRGGYAVAIADIEGNGANEIIVNGAQGHVLDAVSQTLKWSYAGGFGWSMAVGDVDADGKPEIAGAGGANGATITIINGDTQTTSSFQLPGSYPSVASLAIGDGNNDGIVEVVTGDGQWGEIHGWSLTGQELWYVHNPEHGVSGIGIGDPDGDGVNEAIWGAGSTSSGTDGVFVGNPATHGVEWQSVDLDGSLFDTAADLDGDGDVEIVVGYGSSDSGYDAGLLQIQRLDGAVEATLQIPNSIYGNITSVTTGQVDADPALEIVVMTLDWSAGRLHVFDGATHALEWSSPSTQWNSTGILSNGPVIVANIDGDAVSEIIVATTDAKIQIHNGASNFVQASTPALDGTVTDAALADVNGDAIPDLVVGTYSGFYVLKATDLTQRHHLSVEGWKRVAARAGEYAVIHDTQVITYSGLTNAEQWRCTSGTPGSVRARYVTISGALWLAIGNNSTGIELYPAGGSACPAKTQLEQPVPHLQDFDFLDVDGDGREELVFSTWYSAHIDLFSFSTDPRGDADGDGQVFDSDLHALSEYLYGDGTLPRAGADVTGDSSVHPEDLFYLINYRKGTGAPPP
jgi:hypothetical protein